MSTVVAQVTLSAAQVGTSGQITWNPIVPTLQQQGVPLTGKLQLHNESGCELLITLPDQNDSMPCPAGAWREIEVAPQTSSLTWTVLAIIPNQPVALLIATYYAPNEAVDPIGVLGNSPIGISGAVQTSNIQSLTNDGNPPGTSIVESTPNDQVTSSVALKNDASGFLQVLSANVLRKILNVVRGNSGAGKATIQLGDAGDPSITTLYGLLNKISSDAGAITSDGAGNLTFVGAVTVDDSGGTIKAAVFKGPAGNDLYIITNNAGAAQLHIYFQVWNGAALVTPFGIGSSATTPAFIDDSGNLTVDNTVQASSGNLFVISQPGGSANGIALQVWNGSAVVTPFSIGGQINSAPSYVDASGNMVATSYKTSSGNSIPKLATNGGGSVGVNIWEGTTDPAGNASEGDMWLAG